MPLYDVVGNICQALLSGSSTERRRHRVRVSADQLGEGDVRPCRGVNVGSNTCVGLNVAARRRGVIENMHSTEVESPPPPPRVCMSVHPPCRLVVESRSDVRSSARCQRPSCQGCLFRQGLAGFAVWLSLWALGGAPPPHAPSLFTSRSGACLVLVLNPLSSSN